MSTTVGRSAEQKQAGLMTARILLDIAAVNFRPEEPYILTSGWASPVYIDCRKVISFHRARSKIIEMAVSSIEREIGCEAMDAVAGGETAGIPYSAWIADRMALPMLYVRKKAKGFGRNAQIEGHFTEGQRTLLVEDLASDGASKVAFCRAIREAGLTVSHAFVVFFYGVFPGSLRNLEEMGISLHYLANWWDVLEVAENGHYFDKSALSEVRTFLHDPLRWSASHGGKGA